MKNKTRKQHFVPRCLSKNFSNKEGFIFRFDKKTDEIVKTSSADLYAKRDFYTFYKNPIMEDFYSREIETKTSVALRRVIHDLSLQNLTDEEIDRLLAFCLVQSQRTAVMREGIEKIERKLLEITLAHLDAQDRLENKPEGIKLDDIQIQIDPEHIKYVQAHNLLKGFSSFMQAIKYNKHLYLLHAGHGTYYLGDHPVVMHQSHPIPPYGSYGYMVPYIEIYCPLSSKLTLAILDKNLPLTHIHPNKSSLLMNQARVEFLNRLQVGWASRYVASAEEDFSTARDFLSQNPSFRTEPDGRISI
ncbi:MAG: DUF4238 domain-containing protein [Candidatus Avelusimicrobium sp.]|uniref:DUF4238 domain-containing protein n=1 Tax=Candidatus Avelusimicrobium sp. TaxID=3048833 RepID=UPI003F06107E